MKLEGADDADWASCAIHRRSVTDYVSTYGGTPISWEAKKQRTVALSAAEVQYMRRKSIKFVVLVYLLIFRGVKVPNDGRTK